MDIQNSVMISKAEKDQNLSKRNAREIFEEIEETGRPKAKIRVK